MSSTTPHLDQHLRNLILIDQQYVDSDYTGETTRVIYKNICTLTARYNTNMISKHAYEKGIKELYDDFPYVDIYHLKVLARQKYHSR